MLSEAIKRARVHILVDNHVKKKHCQTNHSHESSDSADDQVQLLNATSNFNVSYWKLKLLDTLLFFIQMVTSYVLMLVVMSYSFYFLIAVVLGQSLGNLVFFYKPKVTFHFAQSKEEQHPCSNNIPTEEENVAEEQVQPVAEDPNVITVEVHHHD